MKMLLAIINYDDAHCVMGHLMEAGFQITKLATTGGFLRLKQCHCPDWFGGLPC